LNELPIPLQQDHSTWVLHTPGPVSTTPYTWEPKNNVKSQRNVFTGSLMFIELLNLQHGSKSSRPKETC
jgi:hypothetical protein